jgi:hypothetical protein
MDTWNIFRGNAGIQPIDASTKISHWAVWRQDDSGSQFLMEDHLTEDRAKALVAEFEARGHKQTYWCCDKMIR